MPDLTDPNWLDVLIGATALISGILLTVYLYLRQRNRKELTYEILASAPVLTVDEQLSGDIRVLYKDEPVANVHLIQLAVQNSGNVPITIDDFSTELAFSFGVQARTLSAELTHKEPSDLPARLRQSGGGRGTVLCKLLLNPKDTVQLKFLLTNWEQEIIPSARIVGVRQVRQRKKRSPVQTIVAAALATIFLFGASVGIASNILAGKVTSGEISFIEAAIVVAIFLAYIAALSSTSSAVAENAFLKSKSKS